MHKCVYVCTCCVHAHACLCVVCVCVCMSSCVSTLCGICVCVLELATDYALILLVVRVWQELNTSIMKSKVTLQTIEILRKESQEVDSNNI